MKTIYLDHNSTTPLHPEVLEAMLPYYKEFYGNASSIHSKGREARSAVDKARETVGNFLGTEAVDIVFTSGGTESDNFAIKGAAFRNRDKKDHIITSMIEHSAVLNTCKFLEKMGFKVTYLPVDKYGMVNPADVRNAITDKTILVSIMHANNEVGTVQPIGEIGKITREKGVYLHTDAVQSVGKIKTNVEELKVDLLSMSAHKFYGPKGVGALYIRKGVKLMPYQHGGQHERRMRAGTENVPGIVGMGKAIELAMQDMEEKTKRIRNLAEYLYRGLMERLDHVHLNGHPTERIPGTLNLGFEFVEGEGLILNFDMKGIYASTGSACTSGSLEPSHVLVAMGVDPVVTQGAIRFSLGNSNTSEDMDYCLEVIPPIVKRLRAMSPLL
ncbi:MAG: cysteine desulfurase NifS [Candidatus Omnitrophica bacterium]|nr:cysteine desulfurase NifS [Candidatus Omnitrophota bacterium]